MMQSKNYKYRFPRWILFMRPYILIGGLIMTFLQGNAFAGESIREPAVAGQFYSDNPSKLRKEVEGYIAAAPKSPLTTRLLISPHAGFVFSGPVAGKGYAVIDKSVTTVIVVGPSHHEWFSGVSISSADYYETPLGKVPLAKEIITQLRKSPLVHFSEAADAPEHSLEVQLPFLQIALPKFSLVPVITSNVAAKDVADLLLPVITPTTLVVASSDLSHYHGSGEAKEIDRKTIQTVLSGNSDGFLDACGENPIRIVMKIAAKLGLSPQLLDARNSYETAPMYGSEDRVVGYASIIFVKKDGK
jgi:MEMO1 family protein